MSETIYYLIKVESVVNEKGAIKDTENIKSICKKIARNLEKTLLDVGEYFEDIYPYGTEISAMGNHLDIPAKIFAENSKLLPKEYCLTVKKQGERTSSNLNIRYYYQGQEKEPEIDTPKELFNPNRKYFCKMELGRTSYDKIVRKLTFTSEDHYLEFRKFIDCFESENIDDTRDLIEFAKGYDFKIIEYSEDILYDWGLIFEEDSELTNYIQNIEFIKELKENVFEIL